MFTPLWDIGGSTGQMQTPHRQHSRSGSNSGLWRSETATLLTITTIEAFTKHFSSPLKDLCCCWITHYTDHLLHSSLPFIPTSIDYYPQTFPPFTTKPIPSTKLWSAPLMTIANCFLLLLSKSSMKPCWFFFYHNQ